MKKIVSVFLIIALAVSLFAYSVGAVDVGGSSSTDVYIKLDGMVTNKYSIDITFGDMVFVYGANSVWDTELHDYVVSPEAEWNPETTGGNLVTITNHSDLPISYATSFEDVSRNYGNLTLSASAPTGVIEKCPVKAAVIPSVDFRVSLEGLPTSLTNEKVALAKIVVTIGEAP